MSFTCLPAHLTPPPSYRCRTRSNTGVRCAASPFGDAKNKASTSSQSPFGGAAPSPFGSSAKTVAADPFASGTHEDVTHSRIDTISPETSLTDALPCSITAAGANPKKQSENSSDEAVKKSATAEYQPWDDVDVFEVLPELRRPKKDGKQHDEIQTPVIMSSDLISNPLFHPSLRLSCERARQVLRTRRAVPENRSSSGFQL